MAEFEHRAVLSDGTMLSQSQYEDLVILGAVELEDGRVLRIEYPGTDYYHALKDELKPIH
jgi:hypothetical protein